MMILIVCKWCFTRQRAGVAVLSEGVLQRGGDGEPSRGGLGPSQRLSGNRAVHAAGLGSCHITAVIFSPFPSSNYICHIMP